jgi:hypothetical protein
MQSDVRGYNYDDMAHQCEDQETWEQVKTEHATYDSFLIEQYGAAYAKAEEWYAVELQALRDTYQEARETYLSQYANSPRDEHGRKDVRQMIIAKTLANHKLSKDRYELNKKLAEKRLLLIIRSETMECREEVALYQASVRFNEPWGRDRDVSDYVSDDDDESGDDTVDVPEAPEDSPAWLIESLKRSNRGEGKAELK